MANKVHSAPPATAIIGTQSFIGMQLLAELQADDRVARVVAVDEYEPSTEDTKTQFYPVDLKAPSADQELKRIFQKEKVKTVIIAHLPDTPPHNQVKSHEQVAIGTFYILNACEAVRVKKIILCSTADVYGAFPENPNFLSEDMPPRGYRKSQFLRDVIDAERQAQVYQKKHPRSVVSVVRPCTILGPYINSYKTRYLRRPVVNTILGFDPLMQFIHEQDVISALVQFIHQNHRGVYNLAADGVLPLSRVIDICGKIQLPISQIGFKSLVQTLWYSDISPAPASYVDFLRYLCLVDNHKIKKTLNWHPRFSSKECLLSFVGQQSLNQVQSLTV